MFLLRQPGTEPMTRLYLTLFAVLIATLLVAGFSVHNIFPTLFAGANSQFYGGVTRGTFELLDERIAGQSGENLQDTVISLKNMFDTPVDLVSRQQLNLPKKALDIVDTGGNYLHFSGDSSAMYRASTQTDAIWSITIDPSSSDQSIALATGPLNLIKEKLAPKDKHARVLTLEKIQRSYDLPLSLHTREALDLTEQELARINNQQVFVRNSDSSDEQYWIEIDKGGMILQAGPFNYPFVVKFLQPFIIVLFLSLLLIGCSIWLWPLWRDLQRLRKAALSIGNGDLETRVQTSSTSLIRPVLDGFNQMATQTEKMVISQRELTSAISHELRTPLARMMFDLEMAKQTQSEHDRSRYLDGIEQNVDDLKTMVDELLTYARQERVQSPIELEEFDVPEMLVWFKRQASRAQRNDQHTNIIAVKTINPYDEPVAFSPSLMAHAVSNTLQNALRFAESKIEIHLSQQQNDWIISIEDDGPGIPVKDHERVFEAFSRLDESRQRDSGNFGLGLSIVRNIARWHQGEANIVPSQSLKGTRIEIRFPVKAQFQYSASAK